MNTYSHLPTIYIYIYGIRLVVLQLYLYEKGILNIYSFTQYYEIDITFRSTRYDLLIGDGMHKMS